jgi:hypothetical protein
MELLEELKLAVLNIGNYKMSQKDRTFAFFSKKFWSCPSWGESINRVQKDELKFINFFLDMTYIGVILCEESIARIPES